MLASGHMHCRIAPVHLLHTLALGYAFSFALCEASTVTLVLLVIKLMYGCM